MVNQEFEGLAINEMADPSCANWVHHVQYVLPQVCVIYTLNRLDLRHNFQVWVSQFDCPFHLCPIHPK